MSRLFAKEAETPETTDRTRRKTGGKNGRAVSESQP